MSLDVRHDVPLASLTTLRVGGPASTLVTADSTDDVVSAMLDADARREPVLVLGGGSNLVVVDEGFAGTVVRIATHGVDHAADGTTVVQGGHDWDDVVATTVDAGLAGVEALSGIPGSTGATPVQNVGAYGQEVADTVVSVRALDRERRAVVTIPAAECGFAYRWSRFKATSRWVVLEVTFGLSPSAVGSPVRYAELARTLGVELGSRAPLHDVRDAVLSLRRGKGMVLDASDPDTVSAGSFFTNPVLTTREYDAVVAAARDRGAGEPPSWGADDGRVKTSAAWLIEKSGYHKGFSVGTARLSTKHTLAVTNPAGGSAVDVLALARTVRDGVRDAFGVELHHEPVIVGASL